MAETAHYHLHITDSDQENFRDWREALNGSGESDMKKIDDALYTKERVFISADRPANLTENDTWLMEVD